jgi:hypothetical protein
MSNENNQLNKVGEVLGLDKMSPEQRDSFLEKTGTVIIDSAIGRLLSSLEEEKISELESKLEAIEDDKVFDYLLETYPELEQIIKEESEALRSEAEGVFGS